MQVLHSQPAKLALHHSWRLPGKSISMSNNLESSSLKSDPTPTSRTRVVREPQRAVYDRDDVNQILDEAFLCHVGCVAACHPYGMHTSSGRDGDVLYTHGSAASRMLRNLDQ